ncbi:MAG: hypothetical protein LBI79_02080 [Nitrososphaerota archaeon]|jgi:hypothetical protein|nr:hypothetical protein [Nitrososphaerota archaeon]
MGRSKTWRNQHGPVAPIWNKNTTRKTLKTSDPLTKANQLIDWEIFRQHIETAIRKNQTKDGRLPYNAILMYKIACNLNIKRL